MALFMTKIDNIARNTSYLTLALVFQKIISFTYFTLLARYVGPASLGKYYFAISFTTIFAIFIDLGFANVLTREVAKDKEKAPSWLANIIGLKVPLAGLALALVFLLIGFFENDPLTRQLVYVSSVSMVLDSFTATFFAVVRGRHNLKYESWSSVIFQLIVLGVGYGALLAGGSLVMAMLAFALASLFNFVYSWLVLEKKIGIPVRLSYSRELVRRILIIGWPFALYGILQRLYTYLDSVFLSLLAGDEAVGLYQVAFKIINALQFLPLAFTASLYPALAAYWQDNREQLPITFERAINYLVIISLPIIIGAIVLADKVVLLFADGFSGAVWPLRISIASLLFIFVNFPIGSLLNACDHQRQNTRNMGIALGASVIFNFLLIPRFQAVGASVVVLATNALMTFLGLICVRRIISYRARKNLTIVAKVLGASIIIGLAIFFIKDAVNVFLATIIGAVLYFFLLFLFRAFRREDILSIAKSFKR